MPYPEGLGVQTKGYECVKTHYLELNKAFMDMYSQQTDMTSFLEKSKYALFEQMRSTEVSYYNCTPNCCLMLFIKFNSDNLVIYFLINNYITYLMNIIHFYCEDCKGTCFILKITTDIIIFQNVMLSNNTVLLKLWAVSLLQGRTVKY